MTKTRQMALQLIAALIREEVSVRLAAQIQQGVASGALSESDATAIRADIADITEELQQRGTGDGPREFAYPIIGDFPPATHKSEIKAALEDLQREQYRLGRSGGFGDKGR